MTHPLENIKDIEEAILYLQKSISDQNLQSDKRVKMLKNITANMQGLRDSLMEEMNEKNMESIGERR